LEPIVLLALTGAAILHASWHALVKANSDQIIAIGGMNITTTMICGLLLISVPPLPLAAYGVVAISVFIHFGYKVALARLYRNTQLSLAYPLARGLCPILATIIAFIFLDEKPGWISLIGICGISLGVCFLVTDGLKKKVGILIFTLAAFAAGTVALYSVIDAYGVRISQNALSFTAHLVFWDGLAFIAYALYKTKGSAMRAWYIDWKITLLTGILGLTSFAIFIWSLLYASVGTVTAIREVSIVFSVLIGAIFLNESISTIRWIGVTFISIGVFLIAFSKAGIF
jgi:drug/metabolite transporter (DMT)-like permease